jgi:hypothetical protein
MLALGRIPWPFGPLIRQSCLRKLLENPVSEGFPRKKIPEVAKLQELKFGGGGAPRTGKEDIISDSRI